jgi:uncharacterized protein (DUF2237 family)
MTSILDKPIQICSLDPITGYNRDGYCTNIDGDSGTHVVCAKLTDNFLNFTKEKGNNLITPHNGFPGLKSGDKWCLCGLRWEEARKAGVAPPVDLYATDKSALQFNNKDTYIKHKLVTNTYTRKKGGKRSKTRKQFLFNPNNPKLSFNVYVDKNPHNTIPIHYKTLEDVKNTIKKLEKVYKTKKYTHRRIWAVGMIMKVRLEVIKQKKPEEYKLAKQYFEFLSERTKMNQEDRYRSIFTPTFKN